MATTAQVPASSRADRSRPRPQPRLRVVDGARARGRRRRIRQARALLALGVVVVVLGLFGLAAAHAVLVSGQSRLDALGRDVATAQADYSASRLEVARLSAPERIVTEAQRRLGMVAPAEVTYLTPSRELAAEVGAIGAGEPDDAGSAATWAAIKPHLGDR